MTGPRTERPRGPLAGAVRAIDRAPERPSHRCSPGDRRTTRTNVRMSHSVQIDIHGLPFSIETGKVAKQADGAVVVRFGASMVLATVRRRQERPEAPGLLPADRRVSRARLRRRAHPRRLLQARGRAGQEGDPDLPADRPADPAALPRRLPQRGPGHLPGDLGRPRERSRRPGDERRLRRAVPVRHPVRRSRRRRARRSRRGQVHRQSDHGRSRRPRSSSSSSRAPRTRC